MLASHWNKENKSEKKVKKKKQNKNGSHWKTKPGLCSQYSATDIALSAQARCLRLHSWRLLAFSSFRLKSKLYDLVYDGTILVPGPQ